MLKKTLGAKDIDQRPFLDHRESRLFLKDISADGAVFAFQIQKVDNAGKEVQLGCINTRDTWLDDSRAVNDQRDPELAVGIVFLKVSQGMIGSDYEDRVLEIFTLAEACDELIDSPVGVLKQIQVSAFGFNAVFETVERGLHPWKWSVVSAGVDEFLVKPVRPVDIARRIDACAFRRRNFIRSATYFGPDRRRHDIVGYSGPRQRDTDSVTADDGVFELE